MRISLVPPPLPHEHGAWAMLALPLALGIAAAWPPGPGAWLLVPAMALLFLSRYAAVSVATRLLDGKKAPKSFLARRILWAAVYVAGATLCIVAAWTITAPSTHDALFVTAVLTLVLGATHTGLVFADRDRTIPGELVGMAALASAAPLVLAASEQPLDRRAVGAGMAALLYFATSLAYIKAVRGLWRGDRKPLRRCLVAHAGIISAIVMLVIGGFFTPLVAVAFLPVMARTAWGVMRPPKGLRQLGWREAGVAVLFAIVAAGGLMM
jgi:YwiC-like protein